MGWSWGLLSIQHLSGARYSLACHRAACDSARAEIPGNAQTRRPGAALAASSRTRLFWVIAPTRTRLTR